METGSLSTALTTIDKANAAPTEAKKLISAISEKADTIGIKYWEMLDAMGEKHSTFSPAGAYFRLQALIVRFTSTAGGLMLSLLGVLFLINQLRSNGSTIMSKLKSGLKMAGWFLIPGAAIAGYGISKIFSDRAEENTMVYDDEASPEDIASLLEGALGMFTAGPIGVLVKKASELLTSGATTAGAPSALAAVTTPTAAAPSAVLSGIQAVAPALTGILSTLTKFVDAETLVYDSGHPSDLGARIGDAVYHSAIALGVDPEKLDAMASQALISGVAPGTPTMEADSIATP